MFRDECLKAEVPFSLGFSKPHPGNPYAHPGAFGMPGTGGSFGFADPDLRIGDAYVMSRMGADLEDPRDAELRAALGRSLGEPDPYHR